MVQSYIKSKERIFVYQPCSDGFAITSQWDEPMFFRAFRTWDELVDCVGEDAHIAFNVPLTRNIESGDWVPISSFVVVA